MEGHKVLIFSKTKLLLNMIEGMLIERDFTFVRLDGDVKIPKREGICQSFNNKPEIFCFLLTSQVSGVGLNLVGADRAIVLDPDWNPANDNQSIDRCYRIGQKRDVIIYRLISTNSVEEKMYQRQVFKQSLSKATVDNNPHDNMVRYFDEGEFADLLKFNPSKTECKTIKIINQKNGKNGEMCLEKTPTLNEHIPFLDALETVQGITNHGQLFQTEEEISPEDDEDLQDKINKDINGSFVQGINYGINR